MIKLINLREDASLAEKIIAKRAHHSEHNLNWFFANCDEDTPYLFIDDSKEGSDDEGILVSHYAKEREWLVFSEPLARHENIIKLTLKLIDYAFSHGAKKVFFECEEEYRKGILSAIKDSRYRACSPNAIETAPFFEMSKWDGNLMQGKDWKDLRYWWNKFFREHKVEFKKAEDISKEDMIALVKEWKKKRTGTERAYITRYINMIDSGFKGFSTRIMIVDGKLAAITAGFGIPNTDSYYSAIGIYDYEIKNIGEVCNMDDLINLKKEGYKLVDFGAGGKELTAFKMKFRPSFLRKVYYFSVVSKDNKDARKKS